MPELPGWGERSEYIGKWGPVEFFHHDFYAQALAKILRGHDADMRDAQALVQLGKVEAREMLRLFHEIVPALNRFPAIDGAVFSGRIETFVGSLGG